MWWLEVGQREVAAASRSSAAARARCPSCCRRSTAAADGRLLLGARLWGRRSGRALGVREDQHLADDEVGVARCSFVGEDLVLGDLVLASPARSSVSAGRDFDHETADRRDRAAPGRDARASFDLSLFAHHRVIVETSNLARDAGQRVAGLDLVGPDQAAAVRDGGVDRDRLEQRAVVEERPLDDRRRVGDCQRGLVDAARGPRVAAGRWRRAWACCRPQRPRTTRQPAPRSYGGHRRRPSRRSPSSPTGPPIAETRCRSVAGRAAGVTAATAEAARGDAQERGAKDDAGDRDRDGALMARAGRRPPAAARGEDGRAAPPTAARSCAGGGWDRRSRSSRSHRVAGGVGGPAASGSAHHSAWTLGSWIGAHVL